MTIAKNSSKLTACFIALLSGALGVLAYSPFDYWPLAFLSTSGLLWLIFCNERRTALLGTFLWGLSYFSLGVHWVQVSMTQFGGMPELVSYLAVLLLAAYLALYPLLFAYLSHRFQLQSPWVAAALFSLTEYLRGIVFTGFPWLQFGYSLIDSPFYGVAPLLGVEGLTFFVVLVSGYLLQIGRDFTKKTQKLTACLPLLAILTVAAVSQCYTPIKPQPNAEPTKVALIQGNIEQKMKWDPAHFNHSLQTYAELIQGLPPVDLAILPESAIPALEQHIQPFLQQLHTFGTQRHTDFILGTLYQSPQGLVNSALVLGSPNRPYSANTAPRYLKHHLVPFGEYVPFGTLLDGLREVFVLPVNLAEGDFIQPPLTAANRHFATAICYEIIFGEQLRRNLQQHPADYLLTISNDAWFGESIGPWQHFQMARMRALELGKPLLRATNTGITAVVNEHGKITAQLPQFQADVLTAEVHPTTGTTLFSYIGQWAVLCLSLLIVAVGLSRKNRNADA